MRNSQIEGRFEWVKNLEIMAIEGVVLFVGGSPTPQATIHLKIHTETAQRETVRDVLDLHFEGLCRETWPLSHQVLRTGIFMA
ncbi:hypothetical protein LOK49_Contig201G00004 [Camellia lanceoleosa]|nr:hypothetical protein LOK49_Contig201G00004 [Camellia lanceoleosa]